MGPREAGTGQQWSPENAGRADLPLQSEQSNVMRAVCWVGTATWRANVAFGWDTGATDRNSMILSHVSRACALGGEGNRSSRTEGSGASKKLCVSPTQSHRSFPCLGPPFHQELCLIHCTPASGWLSLVLLNPHLFSPMNSQYWDSECGGVQLESQKDLRLPHMICVGADFSSYSMLPTACWVQDF